MSVLRGQGKVIYFGSWNFGGWHLAQAQETAWAAGMLGLVSEQSLYNLAARTVELEVLPACQGYGLGVLPWSPLHGRLLGGILRKETEHGRRARAGRRTRCRGCARRRRRMSSSAPIWASRMRWWRWPGCCTSRRSPRRSSGRRRWGSWLKRSAPCTCSWTVQHGPGLAPYFRVRVVPLARLTLGEVFFSNLLTDCSASRRARSRSPPPGGQAGARQALPRRRSPPGTARRAAPRTRPPHPPRRWFSAPLSRTRRVVCPDRSA